MRKNTDRTITNANYRAEIAVIHRSYSDKPKSHELIIHVDQTLDYYFNKLHGGPLNSKTIHALVEDYMDKKYEKPDFNPPEGEAYLLSRLWYWDQRDGSSHVDRHKTIRKPHKRSLHIRESLLQKINVEFKKMNVNAMRAFINHIGPEEEMYAGRQLLNLILDFNKNKDCDEVRVARVVDFVIKARQILTTGKILKYDFDPDEEDPEDTKYVLKHKDLVKKVGPLPKMPRRKFLEIGLETSACAVLGGYFYMNGLAAKFEQIADHLDPDEDEDTTTKKKHRLFSLIKDMVGEDFGPPFELLLGIIVVNEGMKKWNEVKFEQISNCIAEFVQRADRKMEKDAQATVSVA